ncbi:hypothetical protein EE612_033093 [Oryza sativa]|nr:hypothetical protein EE612_033093 [Oryza sativa]
MVLPMSRATRVAGRLMPEISLLRRGRKSAARGGDDAEVEVSVPANFVCPISLEMMRDPVTAPTGITYDRESVEGWLARGHDTCPVTGRPVRLADLVPNHATRRMIQDWCVANRARGVERVPTPRVPVGEDDAEEVVAGVSAAARRGDAACAPRPQRPGRSGGRASGTGGASPARARRTRCRPRSGCSPGRSPSSRAPSPARSGRSSPRSRCSSRSTRSAAAALPRRRRSSRSPRCSPTAASSPRGSAPPSCSASSPPPATATPWRPSRGPTACATRSSASSRAPSPRRPPRPPSSRPTTSSPPATAPPRASRSSAWSPPPWSSSWTPTRGRARRPWPCSTPPCAPTPASSPRARTR